MSPALAIVTGGAYEEGLSTAEAVLQAGWRVSIWDDDEATLKAAQAELPQADARHIDVANLVQIRHTYHAVRSELGPVEALFNMATLKNTFMLGEHEGRSNETVPFWELDLTK